jgi:hypothetical protein
MKKLLLLLAFLPACASNPHDAHYREEKNAAQFGHSRSYVESPEDVFLAARAALDELSRESEPPTAGSLKETSESISTGWVYGIAKNKYVEYKLNDKPARKPLRVRRKYSYSITPSLAGTEVQLLVEEEIMKIDLKTGAEKGWSNADTDPAIYDMLNQRLKEKLRSL